MLDGLFIWAADISPFLALGVAVGLIVSVAWIITWAWSRKGPLAMTIRIVTFPITVVFAVMAIACGISLANDILKKIKGES